MPDIRDDDFDFDPRTLAAGARPEAPAPAPAHAGSGARIEPVFASGRDVDDDAHADAQTDGDADGLALADDAAPEPPIAPPALAPGRAPRSHARPSRPPSRVGTWFDHHLYSFVSSLGRVVRKPWSTLLTVGVMALALALPLGLWAVLANVQRLAGDVQQSREIDVFLKPAVDVARATALAGEVRGRADVASVQLQTPDDGLRALREQGGLAEAIDAVGDNPLPSLLRVTPRGDEIALAQSLQQLPEADLVQHDAQWRKRLDGWLRFGGRVALVLAALLGLGALLVVGNTVRLDIQSRREEIGVLQQLGASDGFIRRPFLYLGAWYGLATGALALGLLTLAALALAPPLAELAASYGSRFALQGFDPRTLLAFVAGAGVLGWLGAGLVTGHYLRQTRGGEG